jgi:hypothetical protein
VPNTFLVGDAAHAHSPAGGQGMNTRPLPRRPTPRRSRRGADPLREAMWRTLMRVRSAVGDYDGVVSTFALYQRALRAAEIAPAAATRALPDQLRR